MEALLYQKDVWEVVENAPDGGSYAASVIQGENEVKEHSSGGSVMSSQAGNGMTAAVYARKSKLAYAMIVTSLNTPELMALVADVPKGNAHEVWKRVYRYYTGATQANKMAKKAEWSQLKMKSPESVTQFANRVKTLWMTLGSMNVKIGLDDLRYQFLNGLPDAYESLVDTLINEPESVPFDEITDRVRAKEARKQLKGGPGGLDGRMEQAHFAGDQPVRSGPRQNGGSGKPGGSGSGATCWSCNKTGHVKRDCPTRPTCGACGKKGHTTEKCWGQSGRPGGTSSSMNGAGGSGTGPGGHQQAMSAMVYEAAHVASVVLVPVGKEAAMAADISATAIMTGQDRDRRIIVDSAASKHMARKGTQVTDGVEAHGVGIHVANGDVLTKPVVGELELVSKFNGGTTLQLQGVMTHPELSCNLLSVSELCKEGGTVLYTRDQAEIRDPTGKMIMVAPRDGGVYVLDGEWSPKKPAETAMMAEPQDGRQMPNESRCLWHCRCGHISEAGLKDLYQAGAVVGLPASVGASKGDQEGLCAGCMQGKAHRTAFGRISSERSRATHTLMRVHSDLQGPVSPTIVGSCYLLLIVDEYSRKCWGYLIERKSDAAARIMEWCRRVTTEQKVKGVTEFHSDKGGEFISRELLSFFDQHGTVATTTTAGTPQHNGIAERMGRTVFEAARAMMHHAGADSQLWGEAVQTAIYVRNRASLRTGTEKTPDGWWMPGANDAKPSVDGLRVWGCTAWVHVPDEKRTKLESKSIAMVFVGYSEERHAYRFLDTETSKIAVSRDARFDEADFSLCRKYGREEARGGIFDRDGTEMFFDEAEIQMVTRISLAEHLAKQGGADPGPGAAVGARTRGRLDLARMAGDMPLGRSRDDAAASAPAPLPAVVVSTSAVEAVPVTPTAASRTNGPAPITIGSRPVINTVSEIRPGDYAAQAAPQEGEVVSQPEDAPREREKSPQVMISDPVPVRSSGRVRMVPAKYRVGDEEAKYAELESEEVIDDYRVEEFAMSMLVERSEESQTGNQLDRDPTTYEEARSSPDWAQWEAAMKSELESLARHKTWELVVMPPNRRVIGCKWVFRRKLDSTGGVKSFKARLVAIGSGQRKGVDYRETFAPTLHGKTLRVIFAMAASLNLEMKQMDVPTAFLNATCTDDVYMKIPAGPGVTNSAQGGLVCKLLKTLYGIKQAPREWNAEFNEAIVALGYSRCVSDSCVYVKRSRTGGVIIIPVFVDDVFPVCTTADLAEMTADLKVLMQKYGIKELNDVDVVLGMRVTRDRANRTIVLDQEVYIRKLLGSYGMTDCNSAETPEEDPSVLRARADREASTTPAENVKPADADEIHRYGSLIGALLYAALTTRPDIAHAVNGLARFVSKPTSVQWVACKRVLRYLKGTADFGLMLGGSGPWCDAPKQGPSSLSVTLAPCFCDADWAGDREDRRSMTGVVLKVNGGCVLWMSKKQPTVSLSSAEAEYMAIGSATQEILWLRSMLAEMGCEQRGPTVLQCDNEAAIAIASDDVHHTRTKHIDIRHHFIRDHVKAGEMQLEWVASEHQQADILTKGLGRIAFGRLRAAVMGGQ